VVDCKGGVVGGAIEVVWWEGLLVCERNSQQGPKGTRLG
jgi:hypothetical protein